MITWFGRGIQRGVKTEAFPYGPAEGLDGTRTSVVPLKACLSPEEAEDLAAVCPTGALERVDGGLRLNRGRCILCGACVRSETGAFGWTSEVGFPASTKSGLLETVPLCSDGPAKGGNAP